MKVINFTTFRKSEDYREISQNIQLNMEYSGFKLIYNKPIEESDSYPTIAKILKEGKVEDGLVVFKRTTYQDGNISLRVWNKKDPYN